jgi:hypothetical protein
LKRILSIFFLCVFLFQVGGYYIVFWGMERQAQATLLGRLDAGDYSEEELVVLTIPLALPYPIHAEGFQRLDGEFQYGGESYKLVKQKLENDTLFVVCIRDRESSRINDALTELTKFAHNLPVSNKKALSVLAKLHKDFRSTEYDVLFSRYDLFERTYYAAEDSRITTNTLTVESPPPEA